VRLKERLLNLLLYLEEGEEIRLFLLESNFRQIFWPRLWMINGSSCINQ
jgi:hypothetical protein